MVSMENLKTPLSSARHYFFFNRRPGHPTRSLFHSLNRMLFIVLLQHWVHEWGYLFYTLLDWK